MAHSTTPLSPACIGNPDNLDIHDSPDTHGKHAHAADACLVARARLEASRLRNEAIRDFGSQTFANVWRDANAVWQRMESSAGSASRSARRLQARLARLQPHTPS